MPIGAECEFAASIILNMYWRPTIDNIRSADVGGVVEVRSTELDHGRLIVKPKDSDTAPFVLIVKRDFRFRFGGWILAAAAKRRPLVTSHGDPAYFLPQAELGDIQSLQAFLRQQEGVSRASEAPPVRRPVRRALRQP